MTDRKKSNSPSEVFPFLYLGAKDDLSESKIKKSKITHVLNATKDLEKPTIIEKENFLRIPVLDSQCETILTFLEECVDYIDQRRIKNEKVLVHCVAGISRSATISIAYTMKHLKMNVDRAYEYVKRCRPEISPNLGFMGQLLEYQKKLEGESEIIENEGEKDSPLQSISQKIIAPQVHISLPASSGSIKDRSGLALPLKSNPLKRRHRQSSESKSKKRPCRLRIEPNQNQISRCSKSDPITPIEESRRTSNPIRIHSDTDLIISKRRPELCFFIPSRVRHSSAGNESD